MFIRRNQLTGIIILCEMQKLYRQALAARCPTRSRRQHGCKNKGCPSTKTAHGTPNLGQGRRGTHTRIGLGATVFCDCCCWGGIMVLHTNPGSSKVNLAPPETPVRSILRPV